MPEETVLAAGIIERIGLNDSISTVKYDGKKESEVLDIPNHTVAVKILLEDLLKHNIIAAYEEITGIGHRVVAGGEYFKESAVISQQEIEQIEELSALAPLHNPAHVAAMRAFEEVLPEVLNVAVLTLLSIQQCQNTLISIRFHKNIIQTIKFVSMVLMERATTM